MKELNVLETGDDRYEPEPERRLGPENPQFTIDQHRLAVVVGIIAFFLPVVLWASSFLPNFCQKDSISHFYYTPLFGEFFVAMMAAIALVLYAYRGENDKENYLANMTAFVALMVALIPTGGDGCEQRDHPARVFGALADGSFSTSRPFELFATAQWIHLGAAFVLFFFLAWFSWFVFTRIDEKEHCENGKLKPVKAARNRQYRACALVIAGCIIALVIKAAVSLAGVDLAWWDAANLTFYIEGLALWAFAWSWALKGRLFNLFQDQRDIEIYGK